MAWMPQYRGGHVDYDIGITNTTPLTVEDEKALVDRMFEGDMTARRELIERLMMLVINIVSKYNYRCVRREELASVGMEALIKAVDKFNPKKKARMSTFATRLVVTALNEKVRYEDVRMRRNLPCGTGSGNSPEGNASKRGAMWTDDDDLLSLALSFCSVEHTGMADRVTDRMAIRDLRVAVRTAIRGLPLRMKRVIQVCYYNGGNTSDAAKALGKSQSYASRTLCEAKTLIADRLLDLVRWDAYDLGEPQEFRSAVRVSRKVAQQ